MKRFLKILVSLFLFGGAIALHQAGPGLIGALGVDPETSLGTGIARALQLLVWLFGAVVVILLVRLVVWDGLVQRAIGHAVPALIKQFSDVAVLFATTLVVVRVVFDESILAFVTALSAVGVIAAFGMRGLVNDTFTGLAINIERPFQIGDWVAFHDSQGGQLIGRVEQINWRTTHLIAENQNYMVIPNREIGNSTMINFWRKTQENRYELTVVLDYTVAPDEAKRILLAAVSAVLGKPGFVRERNPVVLATDLELNGVEYLVRYWITPWVNELSPNTAADIVHSSILRHLRLAGITPSYRKLESFQMPKPEILMAGTQAHLSMRKMLGLMDFFSPLNKEELTYVTENSETRLWEAGEPLIEQGEEGDSMFVVLQGLLDVHIAQDTGKKLRVGQIEAGEFFGEMSLLTGEPRGATIRASTPVMTLEITKEVLERLLKQRPELAESISELVAKRHYATEVAKADLANTLANQTQQSIAAQLYGKMRAFFGQG